jgi:hypothetical protein
MSKRSPSADDDDRDRFQATKSRKRSSNKGGGGCSIQSKENWLLLPFVQAPSWSPHSAAGRHTQLAFPVCPSLMMLTLFLYCIPSFPHSTKRRCHFPEAARTRMIVEQQALENQRQALEIQRQALEIQLLILGRGEVPYASPSTDEDDGDRTKQAMLWEKESDDEVPCASLSADEDDCDQKLPAARPAILLMDTVMEIIHLVSQQSNAFEKPTIAELEIMLHAMSNMHEPSVVQGSDEADNHLVKMIRGKLIAEQLPHSSDRPFGNARQTTNGIGMGNSWVPSINLNVVKTAEEMQTDYPVRRDETFRHGYIPYKKMKPG